MKLLDPNNEVMQGLGHLFYLIVLGLLWLLFSLTIIGIGPASVALYYAVVKSVRRERSNPFREFFYALRLKQNLLTSLVVNVLLLLFGWVVFSYDWNYIILWIKNGTVIDVPQTILAIVKIFFLMGIACYVYPLLSRFKVNIPKALILSFFFCFRYFWITILSVSLLFLTLLIVFVCPAICWLLPGVFVWLLSFPMETVLRKYVPEADQTGSDTWYMEK